LTGETDETQIVAFRLLFVL